MRKWCCHFQIPLGIVPSLHSPHHAFNTCHIPLPHLDVVMAGLGLDVAGELLTPRLVERRKQLRGLQLEALEVRQEVLKGKAEAVSKYEQG